MCCVFPHNQTLKTVLSVWCLNTVKQRPENHHLQNQTIPDALQAAESCVPSMDQIPAAEG